MFDYMKELQKTFSPEPEQPNYRAELEQLQRELMAALDKARYRKLLRLLDGMYERQDRLLLSNFMEGFRLAAGIAKELSMEEPYSFDRAEEKRGEGLSGGIIDDDVS